jgi:hypothetical protein
MPIHTLEFFELKVTDICLTAVSDVAMMMRGIGTNHSPFDCFLQVVYADPVSSRIVFIHKMI